MNLKEIRDDVRSLIIEPTPGFRSDAELNRWINQAHLELAMHYRLEEYFNIRVMPGVTFYDIPENLLSFEGAWWDDGTPISIVPATSGTRLSEEDNEVSIFRFGERIALIPAPSDEHMNRVITILYNRTPKQLISDDDVPELAEPYHRYLVSYAVMRALQKDEDYEAAAVYSAEYESIKETVAGHKTPLSKDADTILELVRLGILNAAEAAEWLNIPLKKKVWQRVEVEEKGFALLGAGAIDKSDLIKNVEFTDNEKIKERLEHTLSDFATLPGWEGDSRGE